MESEYFVNFDDGDRGRVKRSQIRLIDRLDLIGPEPGAGAVVWAQWRPNAWFHGKLAAASAVGFQVHFDDGDKADLPAALIAPDLVPPIDSLHVGARVLAAFGGYLYPATIVAIETDSDA